MVKIPENERYFALALIHLGETLVKMGNMRLRGVLPGPNMIEAQHGLQHAIAALDGRLWTAPVDPQHAKPTNKDVC